jgi:RNase adapter protein RapZ
VTGSQPTGPVPLDPAAGAAEGAHLPDLAIITGMSGAGRSTTANVLEDLGWFVVDNLPPALLPTLAELGGRSRGDVARMAAVVDVRSRAFFADLTAALAQLAADGSDPRIIFLEASDDSLVRRHEAVRRPHPLQGDGRLVDGITREREMLRDLRAEADIVLDTTDLNVHELGAKVLAAFDQDEPGLHATVMSFGFKYGLPVDADLVVDCRFLPNPHWVPELRPLNGTDEPVRTYVMAQQGADEFLDTYERLLTIIGDGYQREGKRYATIAVGCTGGKHRSVAMTEELARRLASHGVEASVVHRDLGRE